MHTNEARAMKRRASHTYFDRELPDGTIERDPYDQGRSKLPKSVGHIPNKNEARTLRRLCAQTGLTPEQVREHKKYRQLLAEAAGPRKLTGPQRNAIFVAQNPWASIQDPVERDKAKFAFEIGMDVKHKKFGKVYAEELRRRAEQKLLDLLSRE